MWQTQDEKKLLLCAQLFQQWLQVAAATLHLEELEKQERRDFLRVDNFAIEMVNWRKACDMSKVSDFCVEKVHVYTQK